ncbi:hypothetical protein PV646_28715 [Streptomyces sp. ID05-26A]|nr:hypothetical protein [Streptomyces sp. ID05-26A]
MTGQQWRTYALLLHLVATGAAVAWLFERLGEPWRYTVTVFLLGWALLGLIVPVSTDRTVGRHRIEE